MPQLKSTKICADPREVVELTFTALAIALLLAIPLGVAAALRPGSAIDHVVRMLCTLGVCVPTFVSGLILIYVFYYLLGWAPDPTARLDIFATAPPCRPVRYVMLSDLLVETIRGQITHPLAHYHLGTRRLLGTGGTITCLVAIHKELEHFDPRKIDHTSLSIKQVRELLHSFTSCTLDQLRKRPGLPAKRADLIIPGTAVVLATMQLLGAKRLHVSVRGLRYGVLTAAIREEEPAQRKAGAVL